jgi:hypothetical protein
VQQLGLTLLDKASAEPSQAAILASWVDVVKQLVTLSLAARDTTVALHAASVLASILNTDLVGHGGAGVVWRRIFGDESVYRIFFDITSWNGLYIGGRREKTEAQGRLLGLLESVAILDWDLLFHPRFKELEARFCTKNDPKDASGFGGLGYYAAKQMIEEKDDVMMHMLLLDFYSKLLSGGGNHAWDCLDSLGLVLHCVTLAVDPERYTQDFLEIGLLQSKASEFVVRICELFPENLNSALINTNSPLGQDLLHVIIQHLQESSPPLPHAPSISILRVLPEQWVVGSSIAQLIPLSPPHPEFLRALASLFRSQSLYEEYISTHPRLWEKIVYYAGTTALADTAVAALEVVDAVVAAAPWGMQVIENAPGAMPLLVDVPDTYLSSRAGADTEATAWRVHRRRWEVAGNVLRRLPADSPWRAKLEQRVVGGVFGKGGSEGVPSAEIATMEM